METVHVALELRKNEHNLSGSFLSPIFDVLCLIGYKSISC